MDLKKILLFLFTFLAGITNGQSIVSFYPDFGYRGETCITSLYTSNLISQASLNEDAYLFLGADTIHSSSFQVLASDTSRIVFPIPVFISSGNYNFHIRVDGIDYSCFACFLIPQPAALLSGSVYFDLDQNGIYSSDETLLAGQKVGLFSPPTTNVFRTITTFTNGLFTDYPVPVAGQYYLQYLPDSSQIFGCTNLPCTISFGAGGGHAFYGFDFGIYGNPGGIDSVIPGVMHSGDTILSGQILMDSLLQFGTQSWGNIEEAKLFGPSHIELPIQNLTVFSATKVLFDLVLDTAVTPGDYSLLMKISNRVYTCQNCVHLVDTMILNVSETNLGTVSDLIVFPNPIEKTLCFSLDHVGTVNDIRVFNALGSEHIFSSSFITKENDVTQIDVSALPAGIYFLELVASRNRIIKRFIKK